MNDMKQESPENESFTESKVKPPYFIETRFVNLADIFKISPIHLFKQKNTKPKKNSGKTHDNSDKCFQMDTLAETFDKLEGSTAVNLPAVCTIRALEFVREQSQPESDIESSADESRFTIDLEELEAKDFTYGLEELEVPKEEDFMPSHLEKEAKKFHWKLFELAKQERCNQLQIFHHLFKDRKTSLMLYWVRQYITEQEIAIKFRIMQLLTFENFEAGMTIEKQDFKNRLIFETKRSFLNSLARQTDYPVNSDGLPNHDAALEYPIEEWLFHMEIEYFLDSQDNYSLLTSQESKKLFQVYIEFTRFFNEAFINDLFQEADLLSVTEEMKREWDKEYDLLSEISSTNGVQKQAFEEEIENFYKTKQEEYVSWLLKGEVIVKLDTYKALPSLYRVICLNEDLENLLEIQKQIDKDTYDLLKLLPELPLLEKDGNLYRKVMGIIEKCLPEDIQVQVLDWIENYSKLIISKVVNYKEHHETFILGLTKHIILRQVIGGYLPTFSLQSKEAKELFSHTVKSINTANPQYTNIFLMILQGLSRPEGLASQLKDAIGLIGSLEKIVNFEQKKALVASECSGNFYSKISNERVLNIYMEWLLLEQELINDPLAASIRIEVPLTPWQKLFQKIPVLTRFVSQSEQENRDLMVKIFNSLRELQALCIKYNIHRADNIAPEYRQDVLRLYGILSKKAKQAKYFHGIDDELIQTVAKVKYYFEHFQRQKSVIPSDLIECVQNIALYLEKYNVSPESIDKMNKERGLSALTQESTIVRVNSDYVLARIEETNLNVSALHHELQESMVAFRCLRQEFEANREKTKELEKGHKELIQRNEELQKQVDENEKKREESDRKHQEELKKQIEESDRKNERKREESDRKHQEELKKQVDILKREQEERDRRHREEMEERDRRQEEQIRRLYERFENSQKSGFASSQELSIRQPEPKHPETRGQHNDNGTGGLVEKSVKSSYNFFGDSSIMGEATPKESKESENLSLQGVQ